jgi:hypothetical protein
MAKTGGEAAALAAALQARIEDIAERIPKEVERQHS